MWSPNTKYEAINGLNLTVDYYDIKVSDMISVQGAYGGVRELLERCVEPDVQCAECRSV